MKLPGKWQNVVGEKMVNTLFNKVLGENEKCVFHFDFKKRKEIFGQLSIFASDSAKRHLPLAVEHLVPRLGFLNALALYKESESLGEVATFRNGTRKDQGEPRTYFLCQKPRKC